MATRVGGVALANPVMTASGTAGYGTELHAYGNLASLGAVVVKSLAADPWAGNPPPRVHQVEGGMLNSVGLQGPGLAAWLEHDLPLLADVGATVVVSLWGHRVEDFARAAGYWPPFPAPSDRRLSPSSSTSVARTSRTDRACSPTRARPPPTS